MNILLFSQNPIVSFTITIKGFPKKVWPSFFSEKEGSHGGKSVVELWAM
jgi:hypothetical protein